MTPSILLVAALVAAVSDGPGIVLDGRFDDWAPVPLLIEDPADAPRAELDLGAVRVSADERFVHMQVGLRREVNLQRLDGRLLLVLDADDDVATGRERHGLAGADAILAFTAPATREGGTPMGGGLEWTTPAPGDAPSPYDVGLGFAPTYASDLVEWRIDRGAPVAGFLGGGAFRARLVLLDPAGAVADETEAFRAELPPMATEPPAIALDEQAIVRDDANALRVVSWNGERGALLRDPASASRVFGLLDPDVVLLQELAPSDTADRILALLERAAPSPGAPWKVIVGSGGGDLHCAVAARRPIRACPEIEPIAMPGRPDRTTRTAGVIVEDEGRAILVLSIHLKCCGRIGDDADQRREAEVEGIRSAVQKAIEAHEPAGIVIAGDYNLVGARRPLDRLLEGLDVDGSALAVVEAMRLNGRSNATWRDPRQPFLPGRLDYCVYGDAGQQVVKSYVLDALELGPLLRRRMGIAIADTDISDHLPLVVDLAWRLRPTDAAPGGSQ